jgi:adenosine kinase
VFGNETEAAAWGAANGLEGASVDSIALAISALPKASGTRGRTVIITQGASPTVIAAGGATSSVAVLPVAAIVDSNGAGDAFVGGYLAYAAKGASTLQAVEAGHWAAAHVIQRSGCSFDRTAVYVPKRESAV